MKILSVSDVVIDFIYSPAIRQRFFDVDFIIGCGDLPYYYLEYILTILDKPLYYVRGNHANLVEYGHGGARTEPQGAIDLHGRTVNHDGLLMAGVEGSVRYNSGHFQYTQREMWGHVLALAPQLMLNRVNHGRFLDIFVTHASPWGIHDQDDPPHHGVKAFNWLLRVFKPKWHLHGHIHIYQNNTVRETKYHETCVRNTYGHLESTFVLPKNDPNG